MPNHRSPRPPEARQQAQTYPRTRFGGKRPNEAYGQNDAKLGQIRAFYRY